MFDKIIHELKACVAESDEEYEPEVFSSSAQVMQQHGESRFPDDKPDKWNREEGKHEKPVDGFDPENKNENDGDKK